MGKKLAEDTRELPRERLKTKGAEALKEEELLAILLRTGGKKQSVLALARQVLLQFPKEALLRVSYDELLALDGMGEAKALTIVAAMELARRLMAQPPETIDLSNPEKVARFLTDRYAHQRVEVLGIILLDNKNKLILEKKLVLGTTQYAQVEPRQVFAPALNSHAAKVILFHTHPSGDSTPSREDLAFTKAMVKAGDILSIPVVDHLIIGLRNWTSLRKEGLM